MPELNAEQKILQKLISNRRKDNNDKIKQRAEFKRKITRKDSPASRPINNQTKQTA